MLGYGAAVLLVFQRRAIAGGARTDDIVQVLWLLIGLGFLAAFAAMLVRRPKAAGELREVRVGAAWSRRWARSRRPTAAACCA